MRSSCKSEVATALDVKLLGRTVSVRLGAKTQTRESFPLYRRQKTGSVSVRCKNGMSSLMGFPVYMPFGMCALRMGCELVAIPGLHIKKKKKKTLENMVSTRNFTRINGPLEYYVNNIRIKAKQLGLLSNLYL